MVCFRCFACKTKLDASHLALPELKPHVTAIKREEASLIPQKASLKKDMLKETADQAGGRAKALSGLWLATRCYAW